MWNQFEDGSLYEREKMSIRFVAGYWHLRDDRNRYGTFAHLDDAKEVGDKLIEFIGEKIAEIA